MAFAKRSAVGSDLPEDSWVEILARVPARSLCRSKCVAKAWRDLIEDPFHRKKLPQTLQGFFSITKDDTCGLQIGYISLLARSSRLQVDPSLSFLTELPGCQSLTFLDSCHGLLLFEHTDKSLGYVVCNPTTKQCGAVPRCDPPPPPPPSTHHTRRTFMYLVFDPTISAHFHLVQFVSGWEEDVRGFWEEDDDDNDYNDDEEAASASVNVYSSESGQWIHIESDWHRHDLEEWQPLGSATACAVLNGMLHFIVTNIDESVQIVAVDVQGVTRKVISVPIAAAMTNHWPQSRYVAQSQGRLHYITIVAREVMSIWVLEDYDTQKWVSKHSVNILRLFGRMPGWHIRGVLKNIYSVVAMHPDGNVVFIVRNWNRKLVSYDMDRKVVNVIGSLENGTSTVDAAVPYVPCFLESPALTKRSE